MSDRCPTCNASMKKYWHKLTPLLAKTLVKFRMAVAKKGKNEVHVPEDLELTKIEYNNFQKLRFHGLVAKVKSNGVRKTGYWLLTRRGSEFLKGKQAVPYEVQTFRNRVILHGSRLFFIRDILGTQPYLENIDNIEFDVESAGEEAVTTAKKLNIEYVGNNAIIKE